MIELTYKNTTHYNSPSLWLRNTFYHIFLCFKPNRQVKVFQISDSLQVIDLHKWFKNSFWGIFKKHFSVFYLKKYSALL